MSSHCAHNHTLLFCWFIRLLDTVFEYWLYQPWHYNRLRSGKAGTQCKQRFVWTIRNNQETVPTCSKFKPIQDCVLHWHIYISCSKPGLPQLIATCSCKQHLSDNLARVRWIKKEALEFGFGQRSRIFGILDRLSWPGMTDHRAALLFFSFTNWV